MTTSPLLQPIGRLGELELEAPTPTPTPTRRWVLSQLGGGPMPAFCARKAMSILVDRDAQGDADESRNARVGESAGMAAAAGEDEDDEQEEDEEAAAPRPQRKRPRVESLPPPAAAIGKAPAANTPSSCRCWFDEGFAFEWSNEDSGVGGDFGDGHAEWLTFCNQVCQGLVLSRTQNNRAIPHRATPPPGAQAAAERITPRARSQR